MQITAAFHFMKFLEERIIAKGIPNADVNLTINARGDHLWISLDASDEYCHEGNWKRGKSIYGTCEELPSMLRTAEAWVDALPSEEGRAIEFAIEQLNKLVGKVPSGTGNAMIASAMEAIKAMLLAKAESFSKNGLPSPISISDIKDASNA